MYRKDVADQPLSNTGNLLGVFEQPDTLPRTENHVPTTPQVWGPFFAVGAPFRSKLSPVGAEGDVLVLDGTVYDSESGEAIPFAVLDVWQASGKVSEKGGEYDYFEEGDERREYKEEINTIGKAKSYDYRVRVVADQNGRYEIESVVPAPYLDDIYDDPPTWRCSHIHFYVNSPGREPLITQIYFKDQVVTPGGYVDSHAKKVEDLHLDLQEKTLKRPSGDFAYKYARFDIVLKRKAA